MLTKKFTVGDAIQAVLPQGTNVEEMLADWTSSLDRASPDRQNRELDRWRVAPVVPTDMFAVAGYLCSIGGVIGFFDPSPYRKDQPSCEFTLDQNARRQADAAGHVWRDNIKVFPGNEVQKLWDVLVMDAWDLPVAPGPYVAKADGPPPWWHAALMLVMISDMACDRLLQDPLKDTGPSPVESWIKTVYKIVQNRDRAEGEGDVHELPPASLGIMADSSIVCVLPKVRVSPVGATMRNVSRNLALLPGRGEVRCFWETPIKLPRFEASESLDILLIPEPRELMAMDFEDTGEKGDRSIEKGDPDHKSDGDLDWWVRDWSTFKLKQSWLDDPAARREFESKCVQLLQAAKRESRTVNAVIFPEYALNGEVFDSVCKSLKDEEKKLDFVIAGCSDNGRDEKDGKVEGNHVMTRIWYAGEDVQLTQSRCKHHRWRLDRSQAENYALSTALNPTINNWWEDTPLGRRQIQFQKFRRRSVFSVLICEELARSDPCHQILRSVAPNLIFALLLDGPQIKSRWPAQYAASLADDPGSSVLTFTSYGLIDRSNKQGKFPPNHSIALWKDDSGNLVEIKMPTGKGMRGVLLSLWSEQVSDRTITGKQSDVLSWRYANHVPVYAEGGAS